jgi:hypothetical protein
MRLSANFRHIDALADVYVGQSPVVTKVEHEGGGRADSSGGIDSWKLSVV